MSRRFLILSAAVLAASVLAAQEPIQVPPRVVSPSSSSGQPAQEPIRVQPRVVSPSGPGSSSAQEPIRVQPRAIGTASSTTKFSPKLEAVAETKVLMEGINQANYRGLERLLKDKPADEETWRFVRGQALLIAESGNLLMLRPPRTTGQEEWMRRSTDLRESAAALADTAKARDFERSRAALLGVANSCNRCHETFRVPTRVGPAAKPGDRDLE